VQQDLRMVLHNSILQVRRSMQSKKERITEVKS